MFFHMLKCKHGRIEQELERAIKEYDKVTEKLGRLNALQRRRAQEDFEGEKARPEAQEEKLKERRDQ